MSEKNLYDPEKMKKNGKTSEATKQALGAAAMKDKTDRALGSAAIKGSGKK